MRECVSLLMVLFFYFFSSFLSIFSALASSVRCNSVLDLFSFVCSFVVFLSNRMSSSKNSLLLWFDSIPFHSILQDDMWFSLQSFIYFMRHDTRSYALCPQFQLFYNKLACYLMLIIKVDRVCARNYVTDQTVPIGWILCHWMVHFRHFNHFIFRTIKMIATDGYFFDGIFYFNRSTNIQNSFRSIALKSMKSCWTCALNSKAFGLCLFAVFFFSLAQCSDN